MPSSDLFCPNKSQVEDLSTKAPLDHMNNPVPPRSSPDDPNLSLFKKSTKKRWKKAW